MARPKKARAEGAALIVPMTEEVAVASNIGIEVQAEPPADGRNSRPSNPVPGDDGDALDRIAASFRERFPDEWATLARCPLQHGLIDMANTLRGKG